VKPTVYIETTVPSYYCDDRPDLAADIARTREWWDRERDDYECFISAVVLDELNEGNYPNKDRCVHLVDGFPLLDLVDEIADIASLYQTQKLMPQVPVRDSLHLALASFYRIDFLLTWNCQHLANANKFKHLRRLNLDLGLSVPQLVTPHQLRPVEENS
jgi:hypothetical protein